MQEESKNEPRAPVRITNDSGWPTQEEEKKSEQETPAINEYRPPYNAPTRPQLEERANRFRTGEVVYDQFEGMRQRTQDVRHRDGSITKVISIGVPIDHPYADVEMGPSGDGLYNVRVGPLRLPMPPTFLVRQRGNGAVNTDEDSDEERNWIRQQAGIRINQRVVHIESNAATEEEMSLVHN
jgi:hypothetical protein